MTDLNQFLIEENKRIEKLYQDLKENQISYEASWQQAHPSLHLKSINPEIYEKYNQTYHRVESISKNQTNEKLNQYRQIIPKIQRNYQITQSLLNLKPISSETRKEESYAQNNH